MRNQRVEYLIQDIIEFNYSSLCFLTLVNDLSLDKYFIFGIYNIDDIVTVFIDNHTRFCKSF